MNDKLTQKQENFTLNIFKGMYQRDAYIDAYHPTYAMMTIDANASRLANNEKILARLAELRALATSKNVMPEIARKERLSELAQDKYKAPLTAREVIGAISELNKMDGVYETALSGFQDNRVVNIFVMDKETKGLIAQVKERTGKLVEAIPVLPEEKEDE